jgi:hypothetical protein
MRAPGWTVYVATFFGSMLVFHAASIVGEARNVADGQVRVKLVSSLDHPRRSTDQFQRKLNAEST